MMPRKACESCGLVSSASTMSVRMKRRRLFLVAMCTHTRAISCSAPAGSVTGETLPTTRSSNSAMRSFTASESSSSLSRKW